MTWYFDPSGDTMDVYDHTDSLVATDRPVNTDDDGNPIGSCSGDYPDEVLVVIRESMDGNQPSAYNQSLLADAATGNIKQGNPP